MKKEIPIETQELVLKELEELGEYDAAEYCGEWNGYDVFLPTFKDLEYGKNLYIGFPPYFIVKDGELEPVMYGIDPRYEELWGLSNSE